MLWARIREAPACLRGGDEIARALRAQAVGEREVAHDLARVQARRDRGQLMDDRLRTGGDDRAHHGVRIERVGDDRLGARRAQRLRALGRARHAGDLVAVGDQQPAPAAGRSRRWRRPGRPSRARSRSLREAALRPGDDPPVAGPAAVDASRGAEVVGHGVDRRRRHPADHARLRRWAGRRRRRLRLPHSGARRASTSSGPSRTRCADAVRAARGAGRASRDPGRRSVEGGPRSAARGRGETVQIAVEGDRSGRSATSRCVSGGDRDGVPSAPSGAGGLTDARLRARAHHAFAEPRRADAEGAVEAGPEVLQGDQARELPINWRSSKCSRRAANSSSPTSTGVRLIAAV